MLDIFSRSVDRLCVGLGKGASVLCLCLVFFQLGTVLLRYVFGIGAIGLQEAVIYCHALLFLLGAAWVLHGNEHVRVDVIYGALGARGRRLVDILGLALFIVPTCVVIGWSSWSYVLRAWQTMEGSRQAGGLPAIYLLKTGILVFALSVGLQGLAIVLDLLRGRERRAWSTNDEITS